MKKMAIVPFKVLEEMQRWKSEHRPRLPPAPQVAKTAELQNKMQHTMGNDVLSESEKAQQYGETLHKFQQAYDKAKPSSRMTIQPDPPSTNSSNERPDPTATGLTERIMESVPKTMQRKARLLLNMVKQHPNMAWNDQGELVYDGKPVHGSHIIDLVNDVLRQRKGHNPRGWEQFSRGLRDVNVPQEVIGNKYRWSWIQKQHDTEESEGESDEDPFYESFTALPTDIKSESHPTDIKPGLSWESY